MREIPECPFKLFSCQKSEISQNQTSELADATHGGANQNIHLTTQPTRQKLADDMLILDGLQNPTGAKFDAGKAQRAAPSPPDETGIASIMGEDGLFYDNAVGSCGVVSDGRNCDRLAIAARRRALALA